MWRQAVDRSQGQLIDINMEYYCTDELLLYIGERCNLLKCLRLLLCHISRKPLAEAVKKFPELEELHLIFMEHITAEVIENISKSCPKLKSFAYNSRESGNPITRFLNRNVNANALAVAKSMPNLRHLALLGDLMDNEGLEVILNSCLRLESLDIFLCSNIDLSGYLGRRCLQQIKSLRRPLDYAGGFDGEDLYDDQMYYIDKDDDWYDFDDPPSPW